MIRRSYLILMLLSMALGCRQPSQRDSFLSEPLAKLQQSTLAADSPFVKRDFSNLPAYRIALKIDPSLERFSAAQTVLFINHAAISVDHIVFHLPPNAPYLTTNHRPNLSISKVQVAGRQVQQHAAGTVMRIELPKPLEAGGRIEIAIDFTGIVPATPFVPNQPPISFSDLLSILGGGGKQKGNYDTYSYKNGILSMAHWYPILARPTEDGFDVQEPCGMGDIGNYAAANYEVAITAPKNLVIATSGVAASEENAGDTKTVHFNGIGRREFTVSASAQFEKASTIEDGITLTSYYLPPHRSGGQKALTAAASALRCFNKAFGKYPFAQLNIVESPLSGGGRRHGICRAGDGGEHVLRHGQHVPRPAVSNRFRQVSRARPERHDAGDDRVRDRA